jgi:acyl-CoA synthetase (AMP-forming)/AMP-acid ligase II
MPEPRGWQAVELVNLSLLLDMAADGFGGRVVVGDRRDGISAVGLREQSARAASRLTSAGATALVYVAVNGPALPVALFAAARAGIPLVPLNYRLGWQQLDQLLAQHHGAVCVADRAHAEAAGRAGLPCQTPEEFLADSAGSADVQEPPDTGAPAVLIYTSGTTSAPKGVLLWHQNLVAYVLGTVEFGSADEDEAALMSVPPYHISAISNVLTSVFAGRRLVTLEPFTPQGWVELVRDQAITNAMVVPTMLARIMETPGLDRSVPSLKALAYGGAKMPLRVIETALNEWPTVDFVNAYGLTETSSTITVLGPAEHREAVASDDPQLRGRLASAGTAVPGVELQIRDETGAAVPASVSGRIWVRGEQVSAEYAGQGSVIDARGFFDTRDRGRLDAHGYLFIEGREDDTIIRGAENIAPVSSTRLSSGSRTRNGASGWKPLSSGGAVARLTPRRSAPTSGGACVGRKRPMPSRAGPSCPVLRLASYFAARSSARSSTIPCPTGKTRDAYLLGQGKCARIGANSECYQQYAR